MKKVSRRRIVEKDLSEHIRQENAAYRKIAMHKHSNGAPMFSPDGTMLDDQGNRSIFDDVDE